MSQSIDEFRMLSVAECVQLVENIWDSIAIDSDDAVLLTSTQREEIQRCLLAHDIDPTGAAPWE